MMRPYMLWLARVYAGWPQAFATPRLEAENLIEAWLNYQHAQRFMVEAGRR